LKALYGAIPGSPVFGFHESMDRVVHTIKPTASPADVAKARQIADNDKNIADILWMGRVMDTADKAFGVVGGLLTAFRLFEGKGAEAFENDTSQRNDAVIKALGLAYLIYHAYPGSVSEKVRAFQGSPAGKALLMYYGAVEVALPFADNAAMWGAGGISRMITSEAGAQHSRLASLAEGQDIGKANEMLTHLVESIEQTANTAKGYVKPITQAIGPHLPSAAFTANMADKAAGALATAADVLPVYTLLSAHLAAESAALRALRG